MVLLEIIKSIGNVTDRTFLLLKNQDDAYKVCECIKTDNRYQEMIKMVALELVSAEVVESSKLRLRIASMQVAEAEPNSKRDEFFGTELGLGEITAPDTVIIELVRSL
ncbi:MAG: hypothetical protein COV29_03190 [Candidatus Yanofskybacteria bacterium CG10_big_fil_rev_8_21_14_0_10_36_16]|uniref:Uncharacterized protein n=1 Tax=Candidatus Yanofskybacteria bacterium CG10_big_fil_rev_8_21_14_0_10_36_16 TaxID=1975096 RepID=A0A2J0Q6Y6_9BACT|nr:MAG: hypothetical protein COV29_03190 [Candidatus Yanofskybacteria bacterium CG10_big_fil_rev_8_21_14_0_10_36_16]